VGGHEETVKEDEYYGSVRVNKREAMLELDCLPLEGDIL
jgi:hypothetical protein